MKPLIGVRVRAPAKINVSLRVKGRRPDGYHELETVFQSLALHDTLTFVFREGPFKLSSSSDEIPHNDSNLVWRAADLLWRLCGRGGPLRDVRAHLVKRTPVGGGLAGGSSNAAATLRGLSAFWKTAPEEALLDSMASSIGADVPYFLRGGAALGLDRGDRIFPLADLPRLWVVLAVPAFHVSTQAAFQWLDETPANPRRMLTRTSAVPGVHGAISAVINDLEPIVGLRHPSIPRLVAALREEGAEAAAMSGSGSSVFGLFVSRRRADVAAAAIQRRTGPSVSVLVSRTIPRAEYGRLTKPLILRTLPRLPAIV
jgi:4-diphosphocytidyl-2-C-methyl-D-erythritol kinase